MGKQWRNFGKLSDVFEVCEVCEFERVFVGSYCVISFDNICKVTSCWL